MITRPFHHGISGFVGLLLVFASVAPPRASAQQSPGPVFADGQAHVVDAFNFPEEWIREELWVETEFDSDGDGKLDRVHVAVVRQAQTASDGLKVPVIYESSPYFSGTNGGREFLWDVRQELGEESPERTNQVRSGPRTREGISGSHVEDWVPRGFAVVHSESPGTGQSQGCPTVGGINESLAPKAVIDWLNGRARGYRTVDGNEEVTADWSTGKVGMTGTSYNGTLPVAAATTGVDGLEAIIPVAPNTSYYHYYRSYGLVRHPGGWLGEDIDYLYDFIHTRADLQEYCNAMIRDGEMVPNQDRQTGDYNEFWAGRDYLNVADNIRAATLMAHAFNDWNVMPEHSVRILEAVKANGVPYQSYFHQGGHGGPPPLELMNKWFTRYLYGVENGVEKDPKAWIVREGADRLEPTPYPDYPHPDAIRVRLYPTSGGVGHGGLVATRVEGQGSETLEDNVSFDGATLARAEWTDHRLLYATAPLTEDVHISGTARINVRVAADKPAANLSVWLVSLPWSDSPRVSRGGVITRGWADPQNASSLTSSQPLVPGQFVDLAFDLQPDDQVIPAGQQIGLMIMSSDRDFTLWPKPGTKLTIDLDATSIELPVVTGVAALKGPMER